MSDYLVLVSMNLDTDRRREVYDFMRHADGVMACCHVGEGAYAMRTEESHPALHRRLHSFLEADQMLLVAPLSGAWSGENVTPAFRCFRQRDDD
jgi:hypothetical protein